MKEGFKITAHITHIDPNDASTARKLEVFTSLYCHGGEYIEYKRDVPTKPMENFGPLAVFGTIDDAFMFLEDQGWRTPRHALDKTCAFTTKDERDFCSYVEIWRCEYTPSSSDSLHTDITDIEDDHKLIDILPRGTLLADSVTLKEIAWQNHE